MEDKKLIDSSNNKKKIFKNIDSNKKRIVLILLSIVLLMTIVGVTLAISVTKNISIATGNYGVVISGSTSVSASGLVPIPNTNDSISSSDLSNYSDYIFTSSFTVKGASTNPDSSDISIIYDIALIEENIDSNLLNQYLKWELIKNNQVIEYGDFSDVVNNTRYVLTSIQQDLPKYTATADSYKLVIWISDNFPENFDQSTMMNKIFSATIDVELYTQSKISQKNIYGAETLIAKANDSSITTYTSGDTAEMYTFTHEATSQTPALTDYRYIGSSPNNYITFNNETWRIIGVFSVDDGTGNYEQRIKIIRDSSLARYRWDYKKSGVGSSTNSDGSNDWTDSQLMMMLNPTTYLKSGYSVTDNIVYDTNSQAIYQNMGAYYNAASGCSPASIASGGTFSCTATDFTSTGLNAKSRSQIAEAKYYLGGVAYDSTTHYGDGANIYTFERGETVYSADRSTSWTGLVGLMYPSDYVYTYANGVDATCYSDASDCDTSTPRSGWLFNSAMQWTLAPYSARADRVFSVVSTGYVYYYYYAYSTRGVRPVVYLRSDISITGTGASDDPYIIS